MESKNEEYLKELGSAIIDICYYGFKEDYYILDSRVYASNIKGEKEQFSKLKAELLKDQKVLKERIEKISKVLVEKKKEKLKEEKEKVVPLTDNEKFEKWISRKTKKIEETDFENLTKEIPISYFIDYIGKKGIESFTYDSINKCFNLTAKIKDQIFETKFKLSDAYFPKHFMQGIKNTMNCVNVCKEEVE